VHKALSNISGGLDTSSSPTPVTGTVSIVKPSSDCLAVEHGASDNPLVRDLPFPAPGLEGFGVSLHQGGEFCQGEESALIAEVTG